MQRQGVKHLDQFILDARQVHGDRYNYSKVLYINTHIKVIIICNIHGEFTQEPAQHLMGDNCPKCGQLAASLKRLKSQDDFIQEAISIHGNEYFYTKTNYINSNTHITIICKKHGDYLQKPSNHLSGQGCPKCYGTSLKTTQEFIIDAIEIHGTTYTYSKVNYINCNTPVIITCKKHGEFNQVPSTHLSNSDVQSVLEIS